MPEKTRKAIALTAFFASFVFLQFTLLWLGNRAGDGYLSIRQREMVYYILQIFVISGFFAYAVSDNPGSGKPIPRRCAFSVIVILGLGTAVMLFADKGSLFYLIVTMVVASCLGYLGGAVYHIMSRETKRGGRTALSMGIGSIAAVSMQYILQIHWGVTPLLPFFDLAALITLSWLLLRKGPLLDSGTPERVGKRMEEAAGKGMISRRILMTCLIAAGFLIFESFYNEAIHHLQIRSGYSTYNAYSWPRLMMIPGYALFAAIGDRKGGRLVPVTALCMSLAALLNAVLTDSYWINMCLFYVALSGAVSFYCLSFWHLAQDTRRPALWASAGRILDSVIVLAQGFFHTSAFSAETVQIINIVVLVSVILIMTLNGSFNLSEPAAPESLSLSLSPKPAAPEKFPMSDALSREPAASERPPMSDALTPESAAPERSSLSVAPAPGSAAPQKTPLSFASELTTSEKVPLSLSPEPAASEKASLSLSREPAAPEKFPMSAALSPEPAAPEKFPMSAALTPEPAASDGLHLPLSPESAFGRMRERYALTPRETEVLRELVLTEDKQAVICERLSIKIKMLQKHVTKLYQKTGVTTRSGLTDLYHNTLAGR